LLDLELPLPKKIIGLGWIVMKGGKMSKSVVNVFYPNLITEDNTYVYVPESDLHIRNWIGIISQVDYLIGCDSVGQHMARSLGIKGCVIMGGTNPINMSYPDYFRIIQRKEAVYSPMRISGLQSNLSERLNKECIEYTDEEIFDIYEKIKDDLNNINI
jgi:ADP-heptose:LPS heptosyltransferase